MNMVDDATGKSFGFLCPRETTMVVMQLPCGWIGRDRIPQAVYCGRKNAFVLDREPTIEEPLKGISPKSPVEVACDKRGIGVIVAYGPPGKEASGTQSRRLSGSIGKGVETGRYQ